MRKLTQMGNDLFLDNPVLKQVGWLGASGKVYELDSPPYKYEKASFSPLYIQVARRKKIVEKSWFGLKKKTYYITED